MLQEFLVLRYMLSKVLDKESLQSAVSVRLGIECPLSMVWG